jgi:DNA-binding MarR family transcriptional regulator
VSARPSRRTGPEEARAVVRALLSDDEERDWHGLVDAHDSLTRALDARLVADHRLPLGTLQALIEIAHAEDGSISVSDLAERVRLSPSRTSRLAIELERQGLVERQRDATDTRSTRVAATQAGRDRLLEAAPTYPSTIRTHLFEGLSERDVKQLARILDRIQASRPDPQSRAHAPVSPAK